MVRQPPERMNGLRKMNLKRKTYLALSIFLKLDGNL